MGIVLISCGRCILLSAYHSPRFVIDLWVKSVFLLLHREFLFLLLFLLFFEMFHSLFEFMLHRFKQTPLLGIWFLTILFATFLREGALWIQFTWELIIILLEEVVQQLLLFLNLIFHTSLEGFRCLVLTMLRRGPRRIVFADWVISLETI